MTITTNPDRAEYTATSGQTVFNYTFRIYESTDLNVYQTPAGQAFNDSTDIITAYTVSGVNSPGGGSITLNSGAATGDRITIVSDIPSSRTTDYQVSGDFTAATVNEDIDRTVSLQKQAEGIARRSVLFPQSEQGVSAKTLDTPDALKYWRWKSDNSGVEYVDLPTISTTDSTFAVDDYPALKALDITGISNNQLVGIAYRASEDDGGGGQFRWDSSDNSANVTADPGQGIYVPPNSDTSGASGCWVRQYVGSIYIEWFGGITGSSTANATANATALSRGIDYITSTATGGEIDFGDKEWVIGAITISYTDRYLVLKGNQTKLRTSGAWTIQDGGFLHIYGFEAQPTVAKAHDFLTFSASVDRNARFIVGDCNIGNFDNGIHFTGAASQAYVYRIQLANNNKSVYIESGFTFDHVLFDHLIFGDHDAGSTAFDARANNWSLTNSHFETNHDDTNTYDINAQGQNFRIQNNVMTQSGGVVLNATNGIMSNNILNRCTSLIAIDSQAGENSINNNEIKWDTNTSAGRYDGTNKTGIKLTSANSCDGNTVKRSDIGIDNFVSNIDLVGNKINDAITSGIQIGNDTNVTITGGSIFVGKSGAAGISQTSGNGDGIFIDPQISFVVSGGAVKYSGLGSNVNGVASVTYTAGDNNDYAISGYVNTIRATANASGSAITGIADGYNNRKLTITNISANTLTLENEDTASTAANRILTGTGAAVTLAQNDTAMLYYDDVSDRWRVSSVQA